MLSPQRLRSQLASDVERGLSRVPRSLPPHIFYDATGTKLFEEICELPEYYVTRAEREIFQRFGDQMAVAVDGVQQVIELGVGSASKTGHLLARLAARAADVVFHPIDVSGEALRLAASSLRRLIPRLEIQPFEGFYREALEALAPLHGRKLVLFVGSSLGNFEPSEAVTLLRQVRDGLRPGDAFILGTDLPKDHRLLLPAYDDELGVTAAFNRNALTRINRELGGTFEPDRFRHIALWNRGESRVEMHLESREQQEVRVDDLGLRLALRPRERIHTENSYKFAPEVVRDMLQQAGFRIENAWRDGRGWFVDWLARAV